MLRVVPGVDLAGLAVQLTRALIMFENLRVRTSLEDSLNRNLGLMSLIGVVKTVTHEYISNCRSVNMI